MNLLELSLKNIGPFKECSFSLKKEKGDYGYDENCPSGKHLILTGENGTGKSILIDAIRTSVYGRFADQFIERDIIPKKLDYNINATFGINEMKLRMERNSNPIQEFGDIESTEDLTTELFFSPTDFVIDYWNSKLSTDKFELKSIEILDEKNIFSNPLGGVHKNIDALKSIVFFDYLKDSENKEDATIGRFFYDVTVQIINSWIKDAKFVGVSRKKLAPIFTQYGEEIEMDKLSSGSIYMIQRMISLLTRAYAIHPKNQNPIEKILAAPGMLLIDEAETHLHPKWQKVLFKNILSIFPNIQIIATTHSPFIVSSLENAEVIVCKAGKEGCYLEVETENYANQPVEEILRTPLFDTDSFNAGISNLLKARKKAIQSGDKENQKKIEYQLETLNPEYFKYLKIGYQ